MTQLLGACAGALAAVLMMASPAAAQTVTLTTTLYGGDETPALNTGALGTAEVSVDVTNREIAVTLKIFNIPTTTTAGHIHVGPRGVAGPVVIDFPATIAGRTGDFTMTFRVGEEAFRPRAAVGIHTMEDAIQAITGGNSYVNIHTTQFPAGEIRGQLQVD
jgi:hypothetical protein